MNVRVKLFAVAKDLAGSDELSVELPAGATISDCVPSARLNVHSNCKDWTPRCWQGFFSRAGSSISGLACNWLATSDGSIATTIGTGDLILMLTCAPSWSGVNPP